MNSPFVQRGVVLCVQQLFIYLGSTDSVYGTKAAKNK